MGGAEAFFCGEGAEDGDGGADAGAAGHLQVFGGVAYVDGFGWAEAHLAESQAERGGMGFAEAGVTAADVGGEAIEEIEIVELAVDAVAVAAGD